MEKFFKLKLVFVVGLISTTLPFFVNAAITTGLEDEFFVEQEYDSADREQIIAKVKKISDRAYFYVETDWWDNLTTDQRNKYSVVISDLADKFDDEIYPVMTSTYGNEWNPGIDSDYRITILFHETINEVAGYFRTHDEFSKIQTSNSNEREMVYLSGKVLEEIYPESYLAHEFMHLITFNQKNRINFADDDVWLNELRAEYAPTLLGYDEKYSGSNLQKRIRDFASNPNDSLIEWGGKLGDYGVINLFAQYIVEQYGIEILTQSLSSNKIGLKSLDYALDKLGIEKTIEEVFIDWQIAVSANDCSLGQEYCYENQYLASIRSVPSLIYLPSTQETHFSLIYSLNQWAGNWYKIIGGNKGLRIEFKLLDDRNFKIPYFVEQNNNVQSLKFLELKDGEGVIEIPYFGQDNKSITLIPSVQGDYTGDEYRFSIDIFTFAPQEEPEIKPINEMTQEELLQKILEIQSLINQLLVQLKELKGESCSSINSNLYFGLKDNSDVKCLQQLLVDENVYSAGIVNGNFFSLTKNAVIAFQEKYRSEILSTIGLNSGTGYVGSMTLKKINQLLLK